MKNSIWYTNQSTTLEYITIYNEDNDYYHCYFKFRDILRHFKYKIDKYVWKTVLYPLITSNEGLNIGKTIWSYILIGKIKEEVKFKDIMKEKSINGRIQY